MTPAAHRPRASNVVRPQPKPAPGAALDSPASVPHRAHCRNGAPSDVDRRTHLCQPNRQASGLPMTPTVRPAPTHPPPRTARPRPDDPPTYRTAGSATPITSSAASRTASLRAYTDAPAAGSRRPETPL